jgi:hypothetical protein
MEATRDIKIGQLSSVISLQLLCVKKTSISTNVEFMCNIMSNGMKTDESYLKIYKEVIYF